ncbi:MAG: phosphonate ABC transporter, permease protein PhnE [Rhodospirillales bacterium]|nr:phosphonate ABC transporter, permease protein PhnE [Rhodospirillales bacterium]
MAAPNVSAVASGMPGADRILRELQSRKTWRVHHLLLAAAAIAFLTWCADAVDLRPREVIYAIPVIGEYFARMWPPKWQFADNLWQPAAETIYIAVWGNVIATLIGLPLGVLAASNVTPSGVVRNGAKAILNLFRSISELIWAIFFVSAVGLGPFPGALALGMNYGGILGRLYAEAIENVDRGPIEAMQATGAGRLQVILFAIFPQALPQFVTYNLYWFEVGVRSATVLGMVGAGGIGFELVTAIRLFEWREVGVVLLLILGMVTVIDFASTYLRSKIY